jgi:hypothetical protein
LIEQSVKQQFQVPLGSRCGTRARGGCGQQSLSFQDDLSFKLILFELLGKYLTNLKTQVSAPAFKVNLDVSSRRSKNDETDPSYQIIESIQRTLPSQCDFNQIIEFQLKLAIK